MKIKKIQCCGFELNGPCLMNFDYSPMIVYDYSYILIRWDIRNCIFIHANNKIGFRKRKGEFFTLIRSGIKYKIKAFGLWGIKSFELQPTVRTIKKNEIKGVRINNELKEIKEKKGLSINIKTSPNSEMIWNKTFVTHKTEIQFDISNIANYINEIHNSNTISQIDNLKTKNYV